MQDTDTNRILLFLSLKSWDIGVHIGKKKIAKLAAYRCIYDRVTYAIIMRQRILYPYFFIFKSQKTMLLVEEKRIPLQISLINMRSYGDKPADFLRKVPGGLLPAIEVNGRIITESQVIMELFDQEFGPDQGFRPMLPSDDANFSRYQKLARLEREYVGWI